MFGVSKQAGAPGRGGADGDGEGRTSATTTARAGRVGGDPAPGRPSVPRTTDEPVSIDLFIEDDEDAEQVDAEESEMIGDPRHGSGSGTEPDGLVIPQEAAPSEIEPRRPVGPAPKNRQELLNELRKNYTEVLGLVRKVDGHLDEQSHRSERLLELAESSARNMECLPELVEQNRRVADALGDLIELTRDARTRQDAAADRMTKTAVQQLESAQRQTAALQTMQAAMHRAGEADEKMADSISGFNDTLGAMSSSTRDLGDTIASMRETDAEREAELARLVANSQKWLVAAVIACGLLAVGALFAVLNNVI